MQSALDQVFSEPLLAAMPQLSEKSHQGVPSSNPALYLGHEVCKSTTALGLRAALHLERVRSRSTGKERDAESGNDYFEARYYASSMGRFMSPDWAAKAEPVPYAKLDDPQTLNLYSYVQNNPLSRADADGHDWRDTVAALGQFVRDTTIKATVGLGIGASVRGVFHFELAARIGVKLDGPTAKMSGITENEAQASVKTKSGELGVGSTVEHTIRSVDVNTGEASGPDAPVVTSSASLSHGGVSVSPSDGGVEIQGSGEALGGGGVTVTMPKEAIGDLNNAVKGITNYFTTPAPPPPPAPPLPPQRQP